MTTMTATWTPSEAQVAFIRTLVAERIPANLVADFWTYNVKQIKSQSVFSATVDDLKARPKVLAAPVAPVRPAYVAPAPRVKIAVANEEGLYRNPADGTLYRVSRTAGVWGMTVSVYSNKAVVRRLTTEGEVVKRGKWTKLSAYQSRQALSTYAGSATALRVLAEWKMTDQEKLEYRTGLCNFCFRGLIDGVSVALNLGPVCAKNYNIPWGEDEVLKLGLRPTSSQQ